MSILEPNTSEPYIINNDVWYRVGVLADGSCFFHSLHYAISPEYRTLTKKEKASFICKERARVSKSVDVESFKACGEGMLHQVYKQLYPNASLGHLVSIFKKEIRYEWVSDFTIGYIQQYYKTKVVIMNNGSPYRKDATSPYKRVVFIVWVDECHYEPLGFPKNGEWEFVFTENTSVEKINSRLNPPRRVRFKGKYT